MQISLNIRYMKYITGQVHIILYNIHSCVKFPTVYGLNSIHSDFPDIIVKIHA
jgi:hypothetical protein